jgi:hypothetical protein
MRYAKVVLLIGLVGCILWLCFAACADAKGYESVGVKEAHAKVHLAEREVAAAKTRLREARSVESQTRAAIATYGVNVGRWVWLARDVGWPATTIGNLTYIIDRESGGSPKAKNPTSTASGLLQFLAFHFDGSGDYGWRFDPFNPRENLLFGWKLYKLMGWSPWAL